MPIKLLFKCGGCFKEAPGTKALENRFVSIDGKGYGLGRHVMDNVQDLAPDGWIAHDPYTGCCYCRECWNDIIKED